MRTTIREILLTAIVGTTLLAAQASANEAPADSTAMLRADDEVTRLESMTVEAENEVQIRFARPVLDVDLDPSTAPGLDWGSVLDVLERERTDLTQPLLASTVAGGAPHLARPWLDVFREGSVARFRPEVDGVKGWSLVLADSRGNVVRTFSGSGKPPQEIAWDGRTDAGDLAAVGLTYSYVLEATDRAGNKRNFVGDSFRLPAYRAERDGRPAFVFTGVEVGNDETASLHLREIASRVNRVEAVDAVVRVVVSARSRAAAEAMAARVQAVLADDVVDGARRVMTVTEVASDAPEAVGIEVVLAD